jgi:tripartite-type tricarboxylate transporter receptor subunit TctC
MMAQRPPVSLHVAAMFFAFVATAAGAQMASFPVKPIRLISPFAPGGGNDTISRVLTQTMTKNIGQSVIVENRPGANTIIGMEIVAKAPPDGYTLVMTSSSLAINAALYPKLPYDSARAFAPVSLIASTPLIVVVHPSLPARSIRELISMAKAKPGELFYPVSGVGNISNLAGELFNMLAGVKLVSVPYKGAAPGLNDLLGGRLSVGFNSALATMPHIRSGKLRAIAVTGSSRAPRLPDVPAVAEAGVPGYEASTWYGVLAPAGTPHPAVQWLNVELGRALNAAEVKSGLLAQGLDLVGGTPEQFAAHIRTEMVKWAKVIAATEMKAE